MFRKFNAVLVFADGTVMYGNGFGKAATVLGEICFNTAITGYQEILTDPSYAGQIITFTFPHIGNTGVNQEDLESLSQSVHCKGLVIREDITPSSNFRATDSFENWLIKNSVTCIAGVDTRAITRKIRISGFQNAVICYPDNKDNVPELDSLVKLAQSIPSLDNTELASKVSSTNEFLWEDRKIDFQKTSSSSVDNSLQAEKKFKIVAVDYGMKVNIINCLEKRGFDIIVVPADATASEIMNHNPDGVFLSNGPGDPKATSYAITVIKDLLEKNLPIFGICLGHQILSLALGCKTKKMHNGHRGSNHPVKNLITGEIEITSHNHGFAVCEENLPKDIEVTHISLFDQTIEGIKSKTKPVFSVQYHPEASPGPHDSLKIFEDFENIIKQVSYA